eukprot:Gb_40787 [translate_table: standard]
MEKGDWIDLQSHPLFNNTQLQYSHEDSTSFPPGTPRLRLNLIAWDGSTRLFLWNSNQQCLHLVDIRCSDPDADTIQATSRFKVFLVLMDVTVSQIASSSSCYGAKSGFCNEFWISVIRGSIPMQSSQVFTA